MRTSRKVSKWRWLAIVAVLAMVAAACAEGTTDTTAETTTTAAPSDDGDSTTTTAATIEGFTYRIGIFNDLTTDNVWAWYGPESEIYNSYVLSNSVPALFGLQFPNILLVPSVASSDPVAATQEGGMWVVEQPIRQGYMWSDGEEVTADDLAFTYNAVKDFSLGGNWTAAFQLQADAVEDDPATEDDESSPAREGITNVTAPDPYTVRIEFSEQPGLAIWQNGIGLAPIMPEHFWADKVEEARGSDDPAATLYAFSGEGAPSGGATIYAGREPGAFAQNTLNADSYYAGTENTFYADGSFRQKSDAQGFDEVYNGSGDGEVTTQWTSGPYASDVLYSIYSDQNAAILALRNGEIDYILSSLGLQAGLKDQITSSPDLNLIANASNGFRYMSYNMRKSPMSEVSFRKGLGCMVDKEFMQTLLQGAAIPAYSLVPAGNTFWANPDVEELCKGLSTEERFTEAVKILTEGGFSWDIAPEWDPDNQELLAGTGTGLKDPSGATVPELELLAPGPGYDPLRSTYSVWIAEWASNLGIPIKANPTGFSVIVDKAFAEGDEALNWDMYILGWGLGDPSLPGFHEAFFASYNDSATGGFNTPGYASDEFDALAAEFLAATDIATAKAAVQAMDRLIVEDAPYVVLFQTPILEAYRTNLQFPFTDTLDGLQNLQGVPGDIRAVD